MILGLLWLQILAFYILLVSVSGECTEELYTTTFSTDVTKTTLECQGPCSTHSTFEVLTTTYWTLVIQSYTVFDNVTQCDGPCSTEYIPSTILWTSTGTTTSCPSGGDCTETVVTVTSDVVTSSVDCWSGCATRPITDTITTSFVSGDLLVTETITRLRTVDDCRGGCVTDYTSEPTTYTATLTACENTGFAPCTDELITTTYTTDIYFSTFSCYRGCYTRPKKNWGQFTLPPAHNGKCHGGCTTDIYTTHITTESLTTIHCATPL